MPDEKIPLQTSAAKELDPNGLDGTALGKQQDMGTKFNQEAYDRIAQEIADEQKEAEQDQLQHNYDTPEKVEIDDKIDNSNSTKFENDPQNRLDYGNEM